MKQICNALALSILATALTGPAAIAQDRPQDHHDNHQYVRHDEWKKGATIRKEDWQRGDQVDYHHYHLKPPPRGYEWREVDGNFVLAAVATGVIASVIAESAAH
jgi:Ni/Co efflux regulator RcnB